MNELNYIYTQNVVQNIEKLKFFPFCLFCYSIKVTSYESLFSLTLCLTLLPLFMFESSLSPGGIYPLLSEFLKFFFLQLLSQLPQTFQFINIAQLQFYFWVSKINRYRMTWECFQLLCVSDISIQIIKICLALQICIVFWRVFLYKFELLDLFSSQFNCGCSKPYMFRLPIIY